MLNRPTPQGAARRESGSEQRWQAPRNAWSSGPAAVLLVLSMLGVQVAQAQQTGTVIGTVTDATTGESLPGASVFVADRTSIGVTTDVDGNYRLQSVPTGSITLRASYIGYTSTDVQVNVRSGEQTVNIQMTEGEVSLDDYVVTGFGVELKRENTAASSIVSGEEIRRLPVQTADAALQGRAAGVQITSLSGAPGAGFSVRVRGVGSISAGSAPLYIIDGVQITSTAAAGNAANTLSSLNPADIESIEVLKDAAAVALYGSQGANGVVVITTRRGSEGPAVVEVSTQYGYASPVAQLDVLDGPTFLRTVIEAARNRATNIGGVYGIVQAKNTLLATGGIDTTGIGLNADALEARIAGAPSYDWQDAAYKTGLRSRVDVGVRGGTENVRYYVAGGYNGEGGQIINSRFDRLSLVSNLDFRPIKRLGIEANVRLSRNQGDRTIADGNFTNSPFFQGPHQRPTDAIFTDVGGYNNAVRGGSNIVQLQEQEIRDYLQNQVAGNLAATYQLPYNFVFRTLAGADFQNVRQRTIRPPEIPAYSATGGSVFEGTREILNVNTFTTLSYLKSFNRVHNVQAVGGLEYRQEDDESFSTTGTGLPSGLFTTVDLTATPLAPGAINTQYKQGGVFSQVKYDYDSRYYLTGSLRYDGSSRFGAENKYGAFYSASAAWDAARESFFPSSIADKMLFRVSHGTTGNSQIGNFASRTLFGSGGSYGGDTGIRLNQIGNAELGWEQAVSTDLGLDYSIAGGRVYGAFDLYNKANKNLLLSRPLPTDAGIGSFVQNVGELRNRGLEFEINTINLNRGGFEWRSGFNIGANRSEVIRLTDDTTRTLGTGIRVGEPLSVYYNFRYAGVNPSDGRSMWYDKSGEITYQPITNRDESVLGSVFPKSSGGFSNTFSFKGFSVETFFNFVFGQKAFQQQIGFFLLDPSRGDNLLTDVAERAWRKPGDVTDIPKLYSTVNEPLTASNLTSSSRFIEDASYVRFKTLTVSYGLPQTLTQRLGLRQFNVFVQGQNLYTWTKYTGIDPELVGTAAAPYPQSRLIMSGLQVQF